MDLSRHNEDSFKIKKAHSGHLIPIVRGICLHSPYDPIVEAHKLLQRYEEKIKNNYRFLFLGLGFGHHIEVLMQKLANKEKEIVVIEKNDQIYRHCLKIKGESFFSQVKFIVGNTVEEIYQNYNFVRFLSCHPVIIPLQAAFDLDQDYFSHLLTYQAPNKLENIAPIIRNQELKDYFTTFPPQITIEELVHSMGSKKEINRSSHLLYAYNEIINEVGI